MPPSGRKAKTRARRAPAADPHHDVSEAETPEALATPTRSSRKRARESDTGAVAAAAAPPARTRRRKINHPRTLDREDTEGTEAAQDHSDADDNGTETATPNEQEIIQHLKVADRQVHATEDYSNDLLEGQEHVPGYGKIAGRDWTFIIRKVEVNIGRPEAHEKLDAQGLGNGHAHGDGNGEPAAPSSKTVVDIDLGPDRQISRSHAIISYDGDACQWLIMVNGRNGLRVDNHPLKRGARMYLRNGSVIEIANTQMAFITTAVENSDGPVWDASIIKQAQKSSEDEDDGEDETRTAGQRNMTLPGSRSQMPDTGAYAPAEYGSQQQQRTHPHSQRALAGAPGTPMRSQQSFMRSSPAANYARGVMMESTESIDYSADTAKDLKPPHSYAQLIGMAILSTQEQQMTLNNIYKWIMANYAFYRFNTGGWQNSIRHNLSLNKAFTKIARRTDEPGKGMKWVIAPEEFDTFVQQGMKGCRRPAPLPATQSTLGSPISPLRPVRTGANGIKVDEDLTPPMHPYQPLYPPGPPEAFTPDRAKASRIGLGIAGEAANASSGPEFDLPARSTPRNGMTFLSQAAGSPPALYVHDDDRVGPLDTPFPLRPSQRLAPPSTLKRPSDFIQFSSPAPFWKMEGLVGSTPFKPYEFSPIKTPFSASLKKAEDAAETKVEETKRESSSREGGERKSPMIQSSSPPPRLGGGAESPTLSRPATAVAKTLSQMAAGSRQDGNDDTDLLAAQLLSEIPQSHRHQQSTAGSSPEDGASVPPLARDSTMTPTTVHAPSVEPMPQQYQQQQTHMHHPGLHPQHYSHLPPPVPPPPPQQQQHQHHHPNRHPDPQSMQHQLHMQQGAVAADPPYAAAGWADDGEDGDGGIDLAK